MKTSTKGLYALMEKEGVVLSTYYDSVGVLTLGIGHTASAGKPRPQIGQKISLKQAGKIFQRDIKKYEARVNKWVTAPMKQREFDALVSFDYNTGGIRYRTTDGYWRTARLVEAINKGDKSKAAALFMNWVTPPEIRGRRLQEQQMFSLGWYGNTKTVKVWDKFPGRSRRMSSAGILGSKLVASNEKPEYDKRVSIIVIAMFVAAAAFIIAKIAGVL